MILDWQKLRPFFGLIVIGASLVVLIIWNFYLTAQIANLTNDFASSTAALTLRHQENDEDISELKERLGETSKSLSQTAADLKNAQEDLDSALSRAAEVEEQVGEITGTVSTLEKLSQTDPELLQKYSKVFFLNEHYAPPRLVEIPSEYRYSANKVETIHYRVWPFLRRLLDRAKRDGVEIYVKSAYRSFEEQRSTKSSFSVTYGAGTANTFSADQGYSEHQLGTTVDFITKGLNGQLDGFEKTNAYQWLIANAHNYGFTLSYPPNNQYYIFEPWHWRFVGEDLAEDLHDDGKYFYDLDQRDIDKYLVKIFD